MIQFVPKSFENGVLTRQPINHGLVQSVRLVGECRGKQALFKQQSPRVLEALRANAVIQSTASSNRIEGVVAPLERIRDLVAHRTTPANPSEQEIAGYREVLSTIHSHPEEIRLTPNVVLQLHRDLFQFAPAGGGHWKSTDNDIMERRPDGASGNNRGLPLLGVFKADIEGIGDLLRRCRNAVLHVPKGKELLDDRIADLVGGVSAMTIRRIHRGFGCLFHEEMVRRTVENNAAQALADPAPEA